MAYYEIFKEELENPNTQYFILDSKGDGDHEDEDYVQYGWDPKRYNLVKDGDLLVYRRPKKSSENNLFYFFGASMVERINYDEKGLVKASLGKPYPFQEHLYQTELDDFPWYWKQKGLDWANFFSQYGMNRILQGDFLNLLKFSEGHSPDEEYDPKTAVETVHQMQRKDYSAEDSQRTTKSRTQQGVFGKKVKANYGLKCAVCGISTKSFLVGSHIVPWSKRKDVRLDPSNGICLCSLHDRAFDQGYITLSNDCRIMISNQVNTDPKLAVALNKIKGKKIHVPKYGKPNVKFLEYHRAEVFEKWLKT